MSTQRPRFDEISVVVQGPVDSNDTPLVVDSIRTHLPDAELILSTWAGSDVDFIADRVDEIVLNEDPGAHLMCEATDKKPPVANNVNRQIVSSAGGIARATRPLVLRLRNDLVLTGANGFLDAFGTFESFDADHRFVEQRIVGNGSGARNPNLWFHCFHPGDFFFFGNRTDLKALFDVPLYLEPRPLDEVWAERASLAAGFARLTQTNRGLESWRSEFCPEVYLFRTYLLQQGAPIEDYSCFLEYSEQWRHMTVDYLVNQFVLMNDEQLGIRSLKYPDFQLENFHVSFEWRDWLNAYTERFGLNDDEQSVAEALTARRARFGLMDVVKRAQLKRPSMRTTPTGLALRVLEALCGAARRLTRGPFPMKWTIRRRAKRVAAQIRRYRLAQAEFESLSAGD